MVKRVFAGPVTKVLQRYHDGKMPKAKEEAKRFETKGGTTLDDRIEREFEKHTRKGER